MLRITNSKINLGLAITSRRPDGFHDLSTVFYPVGWSDVLEIVPAAGGESTLTVTGRPCPCEPEQNLVMRAYRAMAKLTPLPPVDIYLRKVVPDGAGLGGGSSDAAHTLLMLNEMAEQPLSAVQLHRLASGLGSDVPFFLYNRPMLGSGTGTDLTPVETSLDDGNYSILIVKPRDERVSTAEAYSQVVPRTPSEPIIEILRQRPELWRDRLYNQFEETVFPRHPRLAEIKRQLYDSGAVYAAMSGSGAALFGIYDADKVADIDAEDCDVHWAK